MRTLTYKELHKRVDALMAALMGAGVEKGDAVGVFMPMVPEAIVAAYAVGKMGALWMPIFSGFGAPSVAARLRDGEAKVLMTADGTWRRGKQGLMKGVADEAVAEAPSVKTVVVLENLGADVRDDRGARRHVGRVRGAPRGRAPRVRPTPPPRTRSSSPTRRARPAGPRARCTCTVASS